MDQERPQMTQPATTAAPEPPRSAGFVAVDEEVTGGEKGVYRVVRRLDAGGMGEIHLVEDSTQAAWALKMPSGDSPERQVRFTERELRLHRRITHKNVVTLHDRGEYRGRSFAVLEYCALGSLGDLLRAGPLPLDVALEFLDQVAQGLDHVHSLRLDDQGLVHRDVTPRNLLLQKPFVAKLGDFGLVWQIGHGHSHTLDGRVLGTEAYLAPEVLNKSLYGPASDRFAFGACAYAALTGQEAFAAGAGTVQSRILHGKFRPAHQVNSDLPAKVSAVLEKALAQDPDSRFGSAGALVQALREAARPGRGWALFGGAGKAEGDLGREAQRARAEAEDLRTRLEEAEAAAERERKAVQTALAERDGELSAERRSKRALSQQLDAAEAQVAQTEQARQAALAERDAALARAEVAERDRQAADQRAGQAAEACAAVERQRDEAVGRAQVAAQELAAAQAAYLAVTGDRDAALARAEAAERTAQSRVAAAEVTATTARKGAAEAEQALAAAKAVRDVAQAQAATTRERLATVEQDLAAAIAARDAAQAQAAAARERMASVDQGLAAAQERVQALEGRAAQELAAAAAEEARRLASLRQEADQELKKPGRGAQKTAAGVQRPGWASDGGQDQYGLWADLTVKGVVQRLRWIGPGSFWMGSPQTENT